MDLLERKRELDASLRRGISLLASAEDDEIQVLLGDGILNDFLDAIASPKVPGKGTPYEYLLTNKNRLQLLALLRLAVTRNYSIPAQANSQDIFVSPTELQWYPDGVMFVQGKEPFQGLIGLYQAGKVMFGIAARAAQAGDEIGKDDILFLEPEEARRRSNLATVPLTAQGLDQAIEDLDRMLAEQQASEAVWQDYFRDHPWIFGLEYRKIDAHIALDDDRIPDFTAVRVHDSARDIIEIKPPTMLLFQKNGKFRAEFHGAWNQAEVYLDFVQRDRDYLGRKGLHFDNPYCYLIAGHNLSREQIEAVRLKERMNPAIRFRTFNDIRTMAHNTVEMIKQLRRQHIEE